MSFLSVYDAFVSTAKRTPEKDFLVTEKVTAKAYGISQMAVPWQEARRKVDDLSGCYANAGWGHGHRIGLLLENRPDFFYHWFALNSLGVSVVPINTEMQQAELAYLITHSELELVVTLPGRAVDIKTAAEKAGRSLSTITADVNTIPAPFSPPPLADKQVSVNSECALLYTSGTTGLPKGCILPNEYFLRSGEWYASLDGVCSYRRDQERVMTPLPLNHMNAMANSAMAVLVGGGSLIQLDRFHPKTWLESARESGATIVHYLGVMPAMLFSAPASEHDMNHQIRWGFGAGVDRENHARFEKRFGFPLVEAWAMTETGAAACIIANHEPRHVGSSCFGRAEDYVDVRVVDDEGVDVEDGVPGEMLVRSNGANPRRYFFQGYLKNPDATDEAWEGGWFHTGDVVQRDIAGNFYFVDRKKNVIRRSGENISAVEVEGVLNSHEGVNASAVAAVPDSVRGDEVFCCVVREGASDGTEADLSERIMKFALSQLSYFKTPGYIAFVDDLPLTASQKIKRGVIKKTALTLFEKGQYLDMRHMKRRQNRDGG